MEIRIPLVDKIVNLRTQYTIRIEYIAGIFLAGLALGLIL